LPFAPDPLDGAAPASVHLGWGRKRLAINPTTTIEARLALTPDSSNETFFREVDEDLRRDQMNAFVKKYAVWIVLGVVLFLAAVGGWMYWKEQQREAVRHQSEELAKIYADIGAGRAASAPKRLAPLETADNDLVRASAILTHAAVALESNDRKTALSKYRQLANDDGLPEPYRDLGLLRSTALEFDSLKPEEVIARLEPFARAGEPWFGSAGEMTAMAYLKLGKKDQAGKMFAAIAADKGVPDTLRSRAAQIAGTLGVDASASLPGISL
jgi:hypothetical protein